MEELGVLTWRPPCTLRAPKALNLGALQLEEVHTADGLLAIGIVAAALAFSLGVAYGGL